MSFKMAEMAELPLKPKNQFNQNLILIGAGLLLLGLLGLLLFSSRENTKVEIISSQDEAGEIIIDVAGAVQKPGVYRLPAESRINDALLAAGGLSAEADREWLAKNLNLAAPLKDGIKIYIKATNDIKSYQENIKEAVSGSSDAKININTASLSQLDSLPGIGPVLGQRIIDYRENTGQFLAPEDVLKVKGISQNVFEKIKDQISVW